MPSLKIHCLDHAHICDVTSGSGMVWCEVQVHRPDKTENPYTDVDCMYQTRGLQTDFKLNFCLIGKWQSFHKGLLFGD